MIEKTATPGRLRRWRSLRLVGRDGLLRDVVGVAGAFGFLQASRFVAGFAAARVIGPESFGGWQLLSLGLGYSIICHLGTLSGLNRELPIEHGRGNHERVAALQCAGLGFVAIVAAAVAVGFGIASWSGGYGGLGGFAVAWLVLAFHLDAFAQTWLRAHGSFAHLARIQVLLGAITLLAAVPLAARFGLVGFVAGQGMAMAIAAGVALGTAPAGLPGLRPSLDTRCLGQLIRAGLPLMAVGMMAVVLTTCDRVVVWCESGSDALGHYAIAGMALYMVQLPSTVVAQLVYPRMAREWGATGELGPVLRWVRRQAILSLVAGAAATLAVILVFPAVVRAWLPSYTPGIGAIPFLAASSLPMAFAGCFSNMMNTIGRQGLTLRVQVVAVGVTAALCWIGMQVGGLVGVAGAMLAGATVYAAMLGVVGIRLASRNRGALS